MTRRAIFSALAAAAAGAVLWGLISWLTINEAGVVAWGIGALVGYAGSAHGARGVRAGLVCALLTLIAIYGGKLLSIRLAAPAAIRTIFQDDWELGVYRELAKASADLVASEPVDYGAFMRTHLRFRDDTLVMGSVGERWDRPPRESNDSDVEEFKKHQLPVLLQFGRDQPTFEAWRASELERMTVLGLKNLPYASQAANRLVTGGGWFAALGLATAFWLAAGGRRTWRLAWVFGLAMPIVPAVWGAGSRYWIKLSEGRTVPWIAPTSDGGFFPSPAFDYLLLGLISMLAAAGLGWFSWRPGREAAVRAHREAAGLLLALAGVALLCAHRDELMRIFSRPPPPDSLWLFLLFSAVLLTEGILLARGSWIHRWAPMALGILLLTGTVVTEALVLRESREAPALGDFAGSLLFLGLAVQQFHAAALLRHLEPRRVAAAADPPG